MPPVGFEPTFSAGERPKTYALDRAATGTGISLHVMYIKGKQMLVCHLSLYLTYCGQVGVLP